MWRETAAAAAADYPRINGLRKQVRVRAQGLLTSLDKGCEVDLI